MEDGEDLVVAGFNLVVDYDIVVAVPVADFGAGAVHSGSDDFGAIGPAAGQTALQFLQAGRQNKHPDDVLLILLVKLLGALPVDIEQIVLPLLQPGADLGLGGAIGMAENRGPFVEFVGFDHPVKLGLGDEVVVDSVDLARTHWPGGNGYRKGDLRIAIKQHPADRGLARARGRGQDEHQSAALQRVAGMLARWVRCFGHAR